MKKDSGMGSLSGENLLIRSDSKEAEILMERWRVDIQHSESLPRLGCNGVEQATALLRNT